MKQFLDALNFCMKNGSDVQSRAGKVRKAFGYQMQFDLSKGFPAITTKKLAQKFMKCYHLVIIDKSLETGTKSSHIMTLWTGILTCMLHTTQPYVFP